MLAKVVALPVQAGYGRFVDYRGLAVALALAVCAVSVATAATGSRPLLVGERLVVGEESRFVGGDLVLTPSGGFVGFLGAGTGVDGGLAISPDGTRLAEVDTLDLFPVNSVSPALRRRFARLPQSSLQLDSFFSMERPSANGSVSILRTEGSRVRDAIGVPAWAPGGGRIVYSRAARGAVHLWLQSVPPRFAAGLQGQPAELTSGPGRDTDPAWSPDGRWIAFEHASGGASDLLAIHPDGTGLHALTAWRGRESFPDYSPDGREIVFASDLTGRFQLYTMPAQGGLARRITHDDGDDTHARWSPSGRWIAFSSNRDGDNDAYVVDPDGGHQRALTHNASEDVVEDWQAVRDARAPVVRALPSRAAGSRPQVRFTVSDASARVLVSAEVELRDQTDDESYYLFVEPAYVDPRSAGVKTLRVVADETGPPPETQARFCVHAIDPWGNSSTQSCARLRLE